jgi:hypothetical protein
MYLPARLLAQWHRYYEARQEGVKFKGSNGKTEKVGYPAPAGYPLVNNRSSAERKRLFLPQVGLV